MFLSCLSLGIHTMCYESEPQCYLTHTLGLVVSGYEGVPDRGFSLCAVPAFCCGPGISNCMQVYALPTDHREVTESKGTMEIVSGLAQSQKVEF